MLRQLSPSQDWSFMSRWFITCRMDGSTFFTTFSSWWGSDFRSYISTNDWRGEQQRRAPYLFSNNRTKDNKKTTKLPPPSPNRLWNTKPSLEYLAVCKLAVLQVLTGGDGPHAGVGVVVGVFTHAVWEALLDRKNMLS